MARKFLASQLIASAFQRADMENDRINTAEALTYLSSSYAELYDLLVQSGLEFFERKTQAIVSVANQAAYALATDFYAALAVAYQVDTNYWVPLKRVQVQEETRYPTTGLFAGGYGIAGASLYLFPAPSPAGQNYRLLYTPAPLDLATGLGLDNVIDGISGWEEYLIEDVARKFKVKEDLDISPHVGALRDLRERIKQAALNRELTTPRHIVLVEQDGYDLDHYRTWPFRPWGF